MEIRFETIITGHEAATLKLSEIRDRLKKAVIYDEYALQQRDPRPLKGKHLAEGLERFLFICPHCREMDFLESRGMNLHCTNCGWIMEVNHLGFPSKADPFEDFYQWDLWEQRQLLKLSQQEPSVYLQDQCSLYCGRPKRRSTLQGVGKAVLHGDRIVFHGSSIQFLFPLEQITGLNVFKSGYVEFLFNKMQYRIALEADHPSGYKWDIMCRILMGQWKDPEESCDESE
jgi:1-acyl-sn-glycerol-3-phosphate acyltransferase